MVVSRQEKQQLNQLLNQAARELQGRVAIGLLGMLLGVDPWDSTINIANKTIQEGSIVKAWTLEADWLIRAIDAQERANQALTTITTNLEARLGEPSQVDGLAFKVELKNRRFKITGSATNHDWQLPIAQVVMHRSFRGEIIGQCVASVLILRMMGIEALDYQAAFESGRLAGAQTRAASAPIVMMHKLPDLKVGDRLELNLGIPASEFLSLERVEFRVWTDGYWFTLTDVPGLEESKREAIVLAKKDIQDRLDRFREQEQKRRLQWRNAYINSIIDRSIAASINAGRNQVMINEQLDRQDYNRIMNSLRAR